MDLSLTKDVYSFDSEIDATEEPIPQFTTISAEPVPAITNEFKFKLTRSAKRKSRKKMPVSKICPICSRQFTNRQHLEEHVVFHDYMSFKCPFCPALFGTFRGMSRHKTPCGRLKLLSIQNSITEEEHTNLPNNELAKTDKPNFESLMKSYKLITNSVNGNYKSNGNSHNNNNNDNTIHADIEHDSAIDDSYNCYTDYEDFAEMDDFEPSEKSDPDYIEEIADEEDFEKDNMRLYDTNWKKHKYPKRDNLGLTYTQLMKKVQKWKLLQSMQNENGYFCCPICYKVCSKSNGVLNHLRRHSDLVKVFENYTSFFEEDDLPWSTTTNDDHHTFSSNKENTTETEMHSEADAKESTNMNTIDIYKETSIRQPRVELQCVDIEKYNKSLRVSTEIDEQQEDDGDDDYHLVYYDDDDETFDSDDVNDKDYNTSTDLHESIHGTKRHRRSKKAKYNSYRSQLWSKALGRITHRRPHTCSLCNRVFTKPYGIAIHYTRTHNIQLEELINSNLLQQQDDKKQLTDSQQKETKTVNELANEDKGDYNKDVRLDTEDGDDDDSDVVNEKLSELECNINTVLGCMVNDVEVLEELGWPKRDVVHLVTEILLMCGQEKSPPSTQSKSSTARLEWLRENVALLMSICIKEKAMEHYGWNTKPINEVLKEMLNLEIEEMVK